MLCYSQTVKLVPLYKAVFCLEIGVIQKNVGVNKWLTVTFTET